MAGTAAVKMAHGSQRLDRFSEAHLVSQDHSLLNEDELSAKLLIAAEDCSERFRIKRELLHRLGNLFRQTYAIDPRGPLYVRFSAAVLECWSEGFGVIREPNKRPSDLFRPTSALAPWKWLWLATSLKGS